MVSGPTSCRQMRHFAVRQSDRRRAAAGVGRQLSEQTKGSAPAAMRSVEPSSPSLDAIAQSYTCRWRRLARLALGRLVGILA